MGVATLHNLVGELRDWGMILSFLDDADPRPVREQFAEHYGWSPIAGFKFTIKPPRLTYPGDPPMAIVSLFQYRDELVMLFPYSWVVVLQKDGTWEAARMD